MTVNDITDEDKTAAARAVLTRPRQYDTPFYSDINDDVVISRYNTLAELPELNTGFASRSCF